MAVPPPLSWEESATEGRQSDGYEFGAVSENAQREALAIEDYVHRLRVITEPHQLPHILHCDLTQVIIDEGEDVGPAFGQPSRVPWLLQRRPQSHVHSLQDGGRVGDGYSMMRANATMIRASATMIRASATMNIPASPVLTSDSPQRRPQFSIVKIRYARLNTVLTAPTVAKTLAHGDQERSDASRRTWLASLSAWAVDTAVAALDVA